MDSVSKPMSYGPTIPEMAASFVTAVASWASAGFPVVSAAEYELRRSVCDGCLINGVRMWRDDGLYGHCVVCGCATVKRWLATERCPAAKWKATT